MQSIKLSVKQQTPKSRHVLSPLNTCKKHFVHDLVHVCNNNTKSERKALFKSEFLNMSITVTYHLHV